MFVTEFVQLDRAIQTARMVCIGGRSFGVTSAALFLA